MRKTRGIKWAGCAASGPKWGDFDVDEDSVHIRRDIGYAGSIARDGALKTEAANRCVPIPAKAKSAWSKGRRNRRLSFKL